MLTVFALMLLAAKPGTPVQPSRFKQELKAQRRVHDKQQGLPWTPSALVRLLPNSCAGQSPGQATRLPVAPHEQGAVRLSFGRGAERVELFLMDLAGHPNDEAAPHFDALEATMRALGTSSSSAAKTDRLAWFRPIPRGLGFWFPAEHAGLAQGQALVEGRFLVRVIQAERSDAAGRKAAYECLTRVKYREMLPKGRARRR